MNSKAAPRPACPSWNGRGAANGRPTCRSACSRVAAIAFVVITSFQARPAPGGHGDGAWRRASRSIVFCGATIAAMWPAPGPGPRVQLAELLAGRGRRGGADRPAGQRRGVPRRVPRASAWPPWCCRPASAPWWPAPPSRRSPRHGLANGRAPIAGIVLNDFGDRWPFYLLSLFARRLRESNQRAELLLTELEQTRAAQAQAAALAERQRLAREMHDVLAHSLSGLVLNLEGARLLAGQRRRGPAGHATRSTGPTGWPRPGWRRPGAPSACSAATRCPAPSGWPAWPPSSSATPACRARSP